MNEENQVTEVTVEQLEEMRKEYQDTIALRDALVKLEKNAAFKKLIVGYYFNEHPLSMVPLIGHSNETARNNANNNLIGVGALQSFFNAVHNKGAMAEASLEEVENVLAGSVNQE